MTLKFNFWDKTTGSVGFPLFWNCYFWYFFLQKGKIWIPLRCCVEFVVFSSSGKIYRVNQLELGITGLKVHCPRHWRCHKRWTGHYGKKKVVKGKLFQLRRNHRMLKLIRCGSRKYLAPTQGGIVEIPGGGDLKSQHFFFLKGKYE